MSCFSARPSLSPLKRFAPWPRNAPDRRKMDSPPLGSSHVQPGAGPLT